MPGATLDIHDFEAGGFRGGKLTVVGRHKRRTPHRLSGRHVQQIPAPCEMFARAGSCELTCVREYPVQIQRDSRKPLAFEIAIQLRLNGQTLL